jgi:hypothetical protein
MRKRKVTKLPPLKHPSEIPDEELDAAQRAFSERAKSWPEEKRNAGYQKFVLAFERRRANDVRVSCNLFRFWLVCPNKICRRNKSCRGSDVHACFDRFWPHVPERLKFEFRGMIVAMSDGLSYEEAVRKVRADAESHADDIARIEAEQLAVIRALDAAERAKGRDAAPTVQTQGAQSLATQMPLTEPQPRTRPQPRVRML